MIKSIEKSKTPKDYSYILKTKNIDECLASHQITTAVFLVYGELVNGFVFSANYTLPSCGIPFEHFNIAIGAVSNEIVGRVREVFLAKVLPSFIDWMKQLESTDKTSTAYREKHFCVQWVNNGFTTDQS